MEGNSFMFINMIINGIAAVISLVLIFMAGAEKKKTEENRMFFLMGIFNLIAAAMEAADLFYRDFGRNNRRDYNRKALPCGELFLLV